MSSRLTIWWLTGILLFLPFQLRISWSIEPWSSKISAFIQYLDEVTIVIFLPLAIIELYRRMAFNRIYLLLSLIIVLFSTVGLLSGLINGNSLLRTVLGTFDYIKNFIVIFIYAAFLRKIEGFKKIFNLLLIEAVFLGIVAFVQELWAVVSVYGFGRSLYDKSSYFIVHLPENVDFNALWRLGIYRAPSLYHHPNSLGFYSLLILTIYLFIQKRVNPFVFLSIFTGILVSVSRMVYTSFVFLSVAQILLKGRRWLIIPATLLTVLIFSMSFLPDFAPIVKEVKEVSVFRAYALKKAMEVWRDHLLLGAGPGMFGGVVSIVFPSPLYERYNFSPHWFEFMKPFRSLDQFWPQALAETGIIGSIIIVGLILTLALGFYSLGRKCAESEIGGLFTGLAISTVFIFLYSLGSGLNQTLFLFTYSAIGGALGCEDFTDK